MLNVAAPLLQGPSQPKYGRYRYAASPPTNKRNRVDHGNRTDDSDDSDAVESDSDSGSESDVSDSEDSTASSRDSYGSETASDRSGARDRRRNRWRRDGQRGRMERGMMSRMDDPLALAGGAFVFLALLSLAVR